MKILLANKSFFCNFAANNIKVFKIKDKISK